MSFDLRPHLKIDWPAESQLVEGGANKFNNCVPTSFQICMSELGYPDIEPQDWTTFEYGGAFTGGEDFAHAIDFIHKHFQNIPDIRVANPSDTLAAIDAAGKAGFPMVLQCFCDASATFVQTPLRDARGNVMFHMGVPVAYDGANLTIRNVWWGKEHVIPAAFARKMTWNPAGWMAVFARSIVPAPPVVIPPVVQPPPAPTPPSADLLACTTLLAQERAMNATLATGNATLKSQADATSAAYQAQGLVLGAVTKERDQWKAKYDADELLLNAVNPGAPLPSQPLPPNPSPNPVVDLLSRLLKIFSSRS